MNNFSTSNNFVQSFLKFYANIKSPINVTNTTNTETLNNLVQIQNQPLPNTTLKANFFPDFQLIQMTNIERSILAKELLNLPQELKDLLTLVSLKTLSNQTLLKSVSQNIDLAKLFELIQANAKEASSKIAQTIAYLNQNGNLDTKQLKELQFVFNSISPNQNTTQPQFIKNLILLYLPWLPIGENNKFDIEFSSQNNEDENTKDDTITVLIQTQNYGNIKITLFLENSNKVNISIDCVKDFPKERLETALYSEAKNLSITTETNFSEKKEIEDIKQEKTNSKEPKINILSASSLNSFLLLMAHACVKYTIEIDKTVELNSSRKNMLEN